MMMKKKTKQNKRIKELLSNDNTKIFIEIIEHILYNSIGNCYINIK